MTTKPEDPKLFMAFRPEPELARAMAKLKARDGIGNSEMIRRGLAMLLKKKGIPYETKEKK